MQWYKNAIFKNLYILYGRKKDSQVVTHQSTNAAQQYNGIKFNL